MYNLSHELTRITRCCEALHEATGFPKGQVLCDVIQCYILTEYRDFTLQTSWDIDEIRELNDNELMDLVQKRKVERLQDMQMILQKEIDTFKSEIRNGRYS